MEQLVTLLCDYKHGYTQYGGLRPFGVAFLYAGWDHAGGFQMFQSDPRWVAVGWSVGGGGGREGLQLERKRRG